MARPGLTGHSWGGSEGHKLLVFPDTLLEKRRVRPAPPTLALRRPSPGPETGAHAGFSCVPQAGQVGGVRAGVQRPAFNPFFRVSQRSPRAGQGRSGNNRPFLKIPVCLPFQARWSGRPGHGGCPPHTNTAPSQRGVPPTIIMQLRRPLQI